VLTPPPAPIDGAAGQGAAALMALQARVQRYHELVENLMNKEW